MESSEPRLESKRVSGPLTVPILMEVRLTSAHYALDELTTEQMCLDIYVS